MLKRIASESCDTPNHLVGTPRTRNCSFVRWLIRPFAARAFVWDANHAAFSAVGPTVRSLARSLAALVSGPTFPFLLQRDSHHFRGPLVLCLSRCSSSGLGLAIAFHENAFENAYDATV